MLEHGLELDLADRTAHELIKLTLRHIETAGLDGQHVQRDVDLRGSVGHALAQLRQLGGLRHAAVREPDGRADGDGAAEQDLARSRYIVRCNADRCDGVFPCDGTFALDGLKRRVGVEKRVLQMGDHVHARDHAGIGRVRYRRFQMEILHDLLLHLFPDRFDIHIHLTCFVECGNASPQWYSRVSPSSVM